MRLCLLICFILFFTSTFNFSFAFDNTYLIDESHKVVVSWHKNYDDGMTYCNSVAEKMNYILSYKNCVRSRVSDEKGYRLNAGYFCTSGQTPAGEECESKSFEFHHIYIKCSDPFYWEPSLQRCVTYCPPDKPNFNETLGICIGKGGTKDAGTCAVLALDPISTATGESYQPQSPDYLGSGLFPLILARNYKSFRAPEVKKPMQFLEKPQTRWRQHIQSMSSYQGAKIQMDWNFANNQSAGFKQWMHNYQLLLVIYPDKSKVVLIRSNGNKIYFSVTADNVTYTPDRLTGGKVLKYKNNWLYTNPQGVVETYNYAGQLTLITNQQGLSQSLDYDSKGLLIKVTDPANRQLTLTYDSKSRLSKATVPDGNVINYEYGNNGNLVKVIFPDSTKENATDNPAIQYNYDNIDHPYALTSQIDENNFTHSSWTFDASGRAIGSSNFGGNKAGTISYTNGNTTVIEANGHSRTLTFDKKGRLSSVTGGNCGQCGNSDIANYTYDLKNQLTLKTDFNGIKTYYKYNKRGLQTRRIEAFGSKLTSTTTTMWHSDFTLPVKIKSPTKQTDYVYGTSGRLESITEIDLVVKANKTRVTTYRYNETGLLVQIDGPRDDVKDITTFAYNTSNDLISTTDAIGNVTQITKRDAHGHPTTIVDANSIKTTLIFDARNRLISKTVAGNTTKFTYDNIGQLTQIILPTGAETNYEYSGARYLTTISDGQGNRVEYTHDLMGNVTKIDIKDPLGNLQTSQQQIFDGLNRLTSQVDGLNQETIFGYDAVGNQVSFKTPLLKETKQVYDALNRLIETTDAELGIITYSYDPANNLIGITTANSSVNSYSYNGFGNLLSQISPDTGKTTFTYDLAGNLSSKTDAKNITINYRYDVLNRLTTIDYPDNAMDVELNYDIGLHSKGRLSTIIDGSGFTNYTYNIFGQVSRKTTRISGKSYTVSYGYNRAGQLIKITLPSARVVNLIRNTHGNITDINELKDGVRQNLLIRATYVPFGRAKSYMLGNSKTVAKEHNLNGQLISIDVWRVYQAQMTYNSDRNITQLQSRLQPRFQQNFTYDDLNRLTEAKGKYGTLSYRYDTAGNRLTKTTNNQVNSQNYIAGSNQLNSPYVYDANGNRTTDNTRTFTYGHNNRLSETMLDDTGIKTTYLYNGLGQRVKKANLLGVTFYLYDEQGLLIAEADGTGKVLKEYIYFESQPLVMLVGE